MASAWGLAAAFVERSISRWAEAPPEPWTVFRHRALLDRLREVLAPGPGISVLDLGGGDGTRTEYFAAGSDPVVVLEPDPRRIARGRAARPWLDFSEATAERVPFGPERFDRVTALYSFHHFSEPTRALEEAYRVLTPGGILAIVDVRPGSGRALGFGLLHRLGGGDRLRFRTPDQVSEALERAGFSRIRTERIGRSFLVAAVK